MALADLELAVRARRLASLFERARVRPEPHRPAVHFEVALVGHEVDHRIGRRLVDLARHRLGQLADVARELDARELHAVADAEERNLRSRARAGSPQLALDAARAEAGRDQNAVRAAQHVDAVVLDQLRVDALDLDRRVVEDAGVMRAPR